MIFNKHKWSRLDQKQPTLGKATIFYGKFNGLPIYGITGSFEPSTSPLRGMTHWFQPPEPPHE